jgi:hypothetical protein
MADNKILEQMLEHLVNDEKEKAEELFHEYVVARSREIYESLIEAEMKDEDDDEEVEEASEDEDAEDEKVDEEFGEFATEADDEMGGDPTDELEAELDDEMDDDEDMEEKDPEELFQDLDAIVDELQAKFDAMKGGEEGDMDMDDEEMKDDFELETVREYVEKVPAGHGAEKKGAAEKADNTKSTIDNMKNDMGGTTANILKGGEEKGGDNAGLGQLKPQDQSGGNINVPGGKAGSAFSKKEPGHGAEKKGAAEQADKSASSLFRGRR